MTIDRREISDATDCYVIAEVGHTTMDRSRPASSSSTKRRRVAPTPLKLQKRHNHLLYTREFFDKPYENENSFGLTYGEHREALEFGKAEYKELQDYADEIGITFFATAFDHASVDFLAGLNMPAYKMASADLTNLPLLRHGKNLVAARDLPAGHQLRPEDIALKSPGDGLPPYELERVAGAVLRESVTEDTTIRLEMLEELAEAAAVAEVVRSHER